MFDETATNASLISNQTGSTFSGQNCNDIREEQLNSENSELKNEQDLKSNIPEKNEISGYSDSLLTYKFPVKSEIK